MHAFIISPYYKQEIAVTTLVLSSVSHVNYKETIRLQ